MNGPVIWVGLTGPWFGLHCEKYYSKIAVWIYTDAWELVATKEVPSPMQLSERITINPDQCGGRPCIRGMRIRVIDILDLYAAGLTPQQILDEMPDLEMDDLKASLKYAAQQLNHPIVAA